MTKRSPFRYGQTGPEIIRLAVMMYVRFPWSLRNVEDLLHERGIDISYETGLVLVEQIWRAVCLTVLAESGSNLSDTTIPDNLLKSSIHAMGFSD
jgi:hypothetical protein